MLIPVIAFLSTLVLAFVLEASGVKPVRTIPRGPVALVMLGVFAGIWVLTFVFYKQVDRKSRAEDYPDLGAEYLKWRWLLKVMTIMLVAVVAIVAILWATGTFD